ncbi:MAG: c-type cytochrome [Gammaproteobacteria bacterium]
MKIFNKHIFLFCFIGVFYMLQVSCSVSPVTEEKKNVAKQSREESAAGSDVHHDHGHTHTHTHTEWVSPPAEYADYRSDRWADLNAMVRGQQIYRRQCVACHGEDGRGTGINAAGLSHPPADLTNHFHGLSGKGDAYLFWRVSEGGAVEPFFSMLSAMPPFKNILTEDERWDVLAFVHGYFHLGLAKWRSGSEVVKEEEIHGGHGHHAHDHSGHVH